MLSRCNVTRLRSKLTSHRIYRDGHTVTDHNIYNVPGARFARDSARGTSGSAAAGQALADCGPPFRVDKHCR
eukprot:9475976-Pyramimonas_sp.AAC.1